jgi:hypothetical protein
MSNALSKIRHDSLIHSTSLLRKLASLLLSVSTQTRNLPVLEMAFPFPVMAPISSTVLLWIPLLEIFHLVRYVPKLAICHYWYWAWLICTISSTGRPISGTGLCHFRHGHSLGPVPELDSMRVVPFPVPGYAISGTVVFRVRMELASMWVVPFLVPGSASSGMVIFRVP